MLDLTSLFGQEAEGVLEVYPVCWKGTLFLGLHHIRISKGKKKITPIFQTKNSSPNVRKQALPPTMSLQQLHRVSGGDRVGTRRSHTAQP